MSKQSSDKPIKYIYWFAYFHLESPSVRYRAKYPLDFARKEFVIDSRLVFPGYSMKRIVGFLSAYLSALLAPKRGSIIVIQRVRSNFIYANLLKLLVKCTGSRTVYDLDDADYLEYPSRNIYFWAKNCNYISAGSEGIREHLSHSNVKALHVTSPVPDLGIIKSKRNKLFTIGWIGGYDWGHKESLHQLLFPALMKLDFPCKLIMVGIPKEEDREAIAGMLASKDNITVELLEAIEWENEESVQRMIASFDIGIATLVDNTVQRSKSGIKTKQYMNNGVPVVSSDIPENSNVVTHNYNGMLCSSSKEFTDAINRFYDMGEEEYAAFSKNARNSVKNFNHERFMQDLQRLCSL